MSDEVEKLKKELESKQGAINGFLAVIQQKDGENRRLTEGRAKDHTTIESLRRSKTKAQTVASRLMAQTQALIEVAGTYRALATHMLGGGNASMEQVRKDLASMDNIHKAAHVVGLVDELLRRYETEPAIKALCDEIAERYGVSPVNFAELFGAYTSPFDPKQNEQVLTDDEDLPAG